MGRDQSDECRQEKPSPIGSSLIPALNKLQQILAPFATGGGVFGEISLPQVAVVGSQSSGKSSVLEALVGRDFLPRGSGICTRRPLLLMLENRRRVDDDDDDDDNEWGEFGHLPGRRFYDFSKIRREIQAETEREAGFNKGVSDKQIVLKISSPNVLNMTLIDLPGITKVPVGDQPSDIETRIRKMIMAHISQENCIILAVSPANSDLATSDALQMAKEADPSGSRTIGVITKLDIMDRGTNACNFLLGKVIPLHLGYIGVVNRSQEDINHNRSIQAALINEKDFFNNHPVYKGLSDYCGIPQLAKKLNQVLEQHVRMVVPNLKAELNSRMLAVEKELNTYGGVEDSKVEQGGILLNILSRYCVGFIAIVDGNSQEITTKELCGGSRILYILQSVFVKSLEEVDPCEDLNDDDIRIAIKNASGPRNALFVPEVPFEVLVKKQIALLLDPSIQCLRLVHDELIKIGHLCGANELQRFPNLRKRVDEVMAKFFRDCMRPAESMITKIIDVELDYINISNPNFIGGEKAVQLVKQSLEGQKSQPGLARSVINSALPNQGSSQPNNDNAGATYSSYIPTIFRSKASSGENSAGQNMSETVNGVQSPSRIQLRELPSCLRPNEKTEHEAMEISITKLLLKSYYNIVRKNIQDLVPKTIMHFLVNHTKRSLLNTFIKKLYRDNLYEELLQEEESIAAKRKNAQQVYNVLQQAIQTLDEIQYDTSFQWSTAYTSAGL